LKIAPRALSVRLARRGVVAQWAAVGIAAVMVGCAGAPWFLGQPLDDRQVIPPTSRAWTVAEHRHQMEIAHRQNHKVLEIAEMLALEERGALHTADQKRLVDLLKERARDWAALGRPIALAEDLRHIVSLEPAAGRGVLSALRSAERAAGDLWLSLGETARAEVEYRQAERLGADRMVYRFRAVWGASPGDLDQEMLEGALTDLPPRVLAPFTTAYIDSGGTKLNLLRRAWTSARLYGPKAVQTRIEAMSDAAAIVGAGHVDSAWVALSRRAVVATPSAQPAWDDMLFAGPTLARALLPLVDVYPQLTAPSPRSRQWADRLVAEDPVSTDSLEVAALIDARAGRADGAARKLTDLVFYSPDRADGYERAARVWERAGQGRRACLAWERATHFGIPDDPRWCQLLACTRRERGAADAAAIETFVRGRAPGLSCVGPAAADGVQVVIDRAGQADGGVPGDASPADASPRSTD
jgi:hypothetical protein